MYLLYRIKATWRSSGTASECCLLECNSWQVIQELSLHPDSFLGIQTGFLSHVMATTKLSTVCSYLQSEQFFDIVKDWSESICVFISVAVMVNHWNFQKGFWWSGLIRNQYVVKVGLILPLLGFWICRKMPAAFPGGLWAGFVTYILCRKAFENINVWCSCSAGRISWTRWQLHPVCNIKLKII